MYSPGERCETDTELLSGSVSQAPVPTANCGAGSHQVGVDP